MENDDRTILLETPDQRMVEKYGGYRGYKAAFDSVVRKTESNMVAIGQMLIEARDTNILQESPYPNMGEFALKEYGLRPDQTSKFIAIAETYGNGHGELRDEYQQFGYSKLSEMITLPAAVRDSIPPETTRSEIRDIKSEVKAEQQITPLEVYAEGRTEEDDLTAMIRAYLQDKSEMFRAFHDGGVNKEKIFAQMAPSGINTLISRPAGRGRLMLSFYGEEKQPTLTSIREDRKKEVSWLELRSAIEDITAAGNGTAEGAWLQTYGTSMPVQKPEAPKEPEQKPRESKEKPAETEPLDEKTEQTAVKTEQEAEKEETPEPEPEQEGAPMPEPEEPEKAEIAPAQTDRDTQRLHEARLELPEAVKALEKAGEKIKRLGDDATVAQIYSAETTLETAEDKVMKILRWMHELAIRRENP